MVMVMMVVMMVTMMVMMMMMVLHQTEVANYFAFPTNNVLSQYCICSVCPSPVVCCETHKFVKNHFISSLNELRTKNNFFKRA